MKRTDLKTYRINFQGRRKGNNQAVRTMGIFSKGKDAQEATANLHKWFTDISDVQIAEVKK